MIPEKQHSPLPLRPTVIEISLRALQHNFLTIKQQVAPAKVLVVLKANAYGHGLVPCARYLDGWGVDFFGVALFEEAVTLRNAGIKTPILVFGGVHQTQIEHFLHYDLDITASSISKLESINSVAHKLGRKARVHLKIDTGIERIGVHHYNAKSLFEKALECTSSEIVGVYSHFATSEEKDLTFTKLQLERFQEALLFFKDRSLPMPLRHIANSGAILQCQESYLDMVRPGLILYGLYPASHLEKHLKIQPVMSLYSKVVYFKIVQAGIGVSYGLTWNPKQDTRVVTIPLGYADGYMRRLSNRGQVLIRGKRYPIVGTICMDQFMVDIGPQGEAYNGDNVVLIGQQETEEITVNDVAEWAETIPYEVLTAIHERVPRVYVG